MMQNYKVILSDPPWQYRNKKTGGSYKSGACQKYPVLTTDELCALKIPAAKDSVLFLWATVPLLPDAFRVMRAGGYDYKTMLTWHKTGRNGLGYWFRGNTEHLLFGTRGKVEAFRSQWSNIMAKHVLKHSAKPQEFALIIDDVTKGMEPKLEMFATSKMYGWDAIGYDIDGKDIREVLGTNG